MALNHRWRKEWIPLFSQQLRLRSLTQVVAYNVRGSPVTSNGRPLFYFTLHLTSKSAPFYSSEPCSGPNPRWAEIDLQRKEILLSSTGLVVRIWQCGSPDQLVVVWGLHLSGLVPVAQQTDLSKELGTNALVLHLHGCPFISPTSSKPASRLPKSQVNQIDVRKSYSVPSLLRLHRVQLDTAEQAAISESLKQSIQLQGPFPPPSQSLGSPGRQYQCQQLWSAREEARHRLRLLRGERARRAAALAVLKAQEEQLQDQNQDTSNNLTSYYRSLSREGEHLKESKLMVAQTREALLLTTSQLALRRRQLISQLKLIYPIVEDAQGGVKICDVSLLSSEALNSQDESSSSVALGFAAHATVMVATFLDVPLRYPIVPAGSRARVWDLVAPKLPDSEREFPLFSRGRDKIQFNYAVYLLNKDIAQLRWYCGLPTKDLRATLINLRDLLHMRAHPSLQHKRSLSGSSVELMVTKPPGVQPFIPQPSSDIPAQSLHIHIAKADHASTEKPQKSTGSLDSWDYLEPPVLKEKSLEKESTLSCSLDQGLDTLKQPTLNKKSGLLSATKSVNCSEPSLACRETNDSEDDLSSPDMTSSDVDASVVVASVMQDNSKSVTSDPGFTQQQQQHCTTMSDVTCNDVTCSDVDASIVVASVVQGNSKSVTSDTVLAQRTTMGDVDASVVAASVVQGNSKSVTSDTGFAQRTTMGDNSCEQHKVSSKNNFQTVHNTTSKLRTLSEPCSSVSVPVIEEYQDCLHTTDSSESHISDRQQLVQNEAGQIDNNTKVEFSEADNELKQFGSIDNLFAKVASRTEALASKSGSFNLVKSRASTMESS